MDAESLMLLIISLSEVARWDSVLTQLQTSERWARSLSCVRRGTDPRESWRRTEVRSLFRDPPQPSQQ